jgi:hypothetical protein
MGCRFRFPDDLFRLFKDFVADGDPGHDVMWIFVFYRRVDVRRAMMIMFIKIDICGLRIDN